MAGAEERKPRAVPVKLEFHVLAAVKGGGRGQWVRKDKGRRMEKVLGSGVAYLAEKGRNTAADSTNSGELSR